MFLASKSIQNFIKKHEALRLDAYRDVAGIWTIGYGHTASVSPGQKITAEQAEILFQHDLKVATDAVNFYVVNRGVDLQQSQFDALTSLVFNVGQHNIFTKSYNNGYPQGSSLYNLLLSGDYAGAARRFTDFVKAGGKFVQGLYNRRVNEREIFTGDSKKKSF